MSEPPTKRRRTEVTSSTNDPGLPRPAVSIDDFPEELTRGNVIAIVESHEEKLLLLRAVLGQNLVSQQTVPQNGPHTHRVILFVVDDNLSINKYAKELESMEFSVESYTVAMHSSGTNQWPNITRNDIIVVTANMLLDSLGDGSLKLTQAHLLVISDTQRVMPTVTPHPALKIVSDFHSKAPDAQRILAVLTSSSKNRGSLDLSWLEGSFRARAFFLPPSAVPDSWSGPTEFVIEYEAYEPDQDGPNLSVKMREADPDGLVFRPTHYRRAALISLQLGQYAANFYWREGIDTIIKTMASSDSQLTTSLTAIKNKIPVTETFDVNPDSPSYNVTSKLAKLIQILHQALYHGSAFRGIVFVKDRAVSHILSGVLNSEMPFIRAVALCGADWRDRSKGIALCKGFKKGTHNLLISTKSCEDMDIPHAHVIINFDLFDDQLSYAYANAHSKGRKSHLIHLVQRDHNEHRRILSRLQGLDDELRSWIAELAVGEEDLPPMTLATSLDPYWSDGEEDDHDEDYIIDVTTSARLYKSNVVAAVYRFTAELHGASVSSEDRASLSVEEREEDGETMYQCILTFPASTRLPTIVGPSSPSKWEAKREACYQACQELTQVGIMNTRHFPQHPSQSPAHDAPAVAQDVKTANTSAKTHGYPRKSPDFWPNSQQAPAMTLYPTVVMSDNLGSHQHAPVLLLTRAPLPLTLDFNVYFCGSRAAVHLYKAEPLEVDDAQLRALHGYTLRVVKSLTNKPLELPVGSLLCYFAPLDSAWHTSLSSRWPLLSVKKHIPWDAVQLAADYFSIPLVDDMSTIDDKAQDAIVLDRQVEFTMRHFVVKVRHDLTPLSKAEDSAREADYPNFLEYCKARSKDFQGLETEDQPMIEVSAVPSVINNLHPTSAPPTPPAKAPLKYVIPELCYKFTIPASIFRTLWLMPSIMNKLDSYLLTKELNAKLFHNAVLEQQLHIALSTPAAWTEFNYERLEFLGDSFLKVVGSNFCYATMPSDDVGALHTARQAIIGNKVLQECAARVGIPSYIQHKRFVAKLWQPPTAGPLRTRTSESTPQAADADGDVEMAENVPESKDKGKRSKKQRQLDEQNTLWMGDKTIADVVEAILAASFLSGGHEAALQAARRLEIPIPGVAQWSDYGRLAAEDATQAQAQVNTTLPPHGTVQALELMVGSPIGRPDLLGQALAHTSTFGGGQGMSYDRLEFIGDAVLDFLVSRYIWERHPFLSPGGLTMLKSAMVSNQTLAAFCVHQGLHNYLQLEARDLSTAIKKYIDFLEELRKKEYDFAAREHRLPGQYWLDMPMEPPKCLSDVVESILGAVYVSDNFFEVGVGLFFERVFKPFLEAHVRLQTLSTNPKITLLEFLQAEGCQNVAVTRQANPRQNGPAQMDVVMHGKVIASATDPSAAIATRKVSLIALDALANDPELLSRTCDCRSTTATSKTPAPKKQASKQHDSPEDEEAEAAEVEAAMEASLVVEEEAE